MTEGVRRVGDRRDPAERLRDPTTLEQVAHVALAGGEERVGLDVPRADREPPGRDGGHQLVAPRGAHHQVVLQHDGLAVEQESPLGVLVELVEDPVDRVDEPGPERFERPVPLSVPVGVRHQKDVAFHAPLLVRPATMR